MIEEHKDNSHLLDFSKWYEFVVKTADYAEYGHTILPNGEYFEISNFFDYYLTYEIIIRNFDYYLVCPNYHYYCPIRDKTYPICSKSRTVSSYENLIKELEKYRNHYEKMFLYMISKPDSQTYKIRFAVFPEIEHND
jgi:hypothetical protein